MILLNIEETQAMEEKYSYLEWEEYFKMYDDRENNWKGFE